MKKVIINLLIPVLGGYWISYNAGIYTALITVLIYGLLIEFITFKKKIEIRLTLIEQKLGVDSSYLKDEGM